MYRALLEDEGFLYADEGYTKWADGQYLLAYNGSNTVKEITLSGTPRAAIPIQGSHAGISLSGHTVRLLPGAEAAIRFRDDVPLGLYTENVRLTYIDTEEATVGGKMKSVYVAVYDGQNGDLVHVEKNPATVDLHRFAEGSFYVRVYHWDGLLPQETPFALSPKTK